MPRPIADTCSFPPNGDKLVRVAIACRNSLALCQPLENVSRSLSVAPTRTDLGDGVDITVNGPSCPI
jgi:hypothetical protein